MRLSEPAGTQQVVGIALHSALQEYGRRVLDAENREGRLPGLEDLLALGEAAVVEQSFGRALSESDLRQVNEQLRLVHSTLLRERAEIENVEMTMKFEYPRGGHTHMIDAKLDRLDRLPRGGHRIVDYKTGHASAQLKEPEDDDLQLGIYAMALAKHQDVEPGRALGVAEYWLTSTGERGVIDLSQLNYTKIRAKIDKAIDGMLAGIYPKGKERQCWGLCAILD